MKVKESTIRPMGVTYGLSTLHTTVAGKEIVRLSECKKSIERYKILDGHVA